MTTAPLEVLMAWANIEHGMATSVDYTIVKEFLLNTNCGSPLQVDPMEELWHRLETIPGEWHYHGIRIQIVKGYMLNPNLTRVNKIMEAIERAGGNCPCVPSDTWSEDTLCPCKNYRDGNGCHCNLYIEKETTYDF